MNQWWGYLHTQGTIHAKRYFDKRDLEEAGESLFVKSYYSPFLADNREEALKILKNHFFGEE